MKLQTINSMIDTDYTNSIEVKVDAARLQAQDYADIRFTELVGEAPATLNTIHELAAMIQTLKAEDVDGLVELLSRKVDVGEVGSLTSLQTTAKASLVDAVNELFTEVDSGKTLVGNAIEAKGAIVPTNPTFNDLTSAVIGLSTGGKVFAQGTGTAVIESNRSSFTVTGLGFRPSSIFIHMKVLTTNNLWISYSSLWGMGKGLYVNTSYYVSTTLTDDGFTLAIDYSQASGPFTYTAYE